MKSIDFSKPGGFPLTQDQLGYMQSAYTEALTALASVGGADGSPFVIKGCEVTGSVVTGSTYNYSVSDGWIFYCNCMVKIQAQSLNVDTSLSAPYIEIVNSSTPIIYNDGVSHASIFELRGQLVFYANGTSDSPEHFLLTKLLGRAIMPLPVFSALTLTPDGQTITFTRPQTIVYNVSGIVGVNTITLSGLNAKEGCEVILFMRPSPSGAMSVTFIKGGLEALFLTTGSPSLSSSSSAHPILIKIKIVNTSFIPIYIVDSYVL